MNLPNFSIEIKLKEEGYLMVAGVDEAGRGALAGPLFAAAAVFEPDIDFSGIEKIIDSKKLTAREREEAEEIIKKKAKKYCVAEVSNIEIDKYGAGGANILAFRRAIAGISEIDFAIIDGRNFRGFDIKYLCFEKGEDKSISIAAASILAKTARDRVMAELDLDFLEYNFRENFGYGTEEHFSAIKKHGLSEVHRKSFLKNYGQSSFDF